MDDAASAGDPDRTDAPADTAPPARPGGWLKAAWGQLQRVVTPSQSAWSAAAWTLWAVWSLLVLSFTADIFEHPSLEQGLGLATLVALMALISVGLLLLVWLLAGLRLRYRFALLVSLPPLFLVGLATWGEAGALLFTLPILIGVSLVAGSLAALARRGTARPRRVGAAGFLIVGLIALCAVGWGLVRPVPDPNPALAHYHLAGHTLAMPDPGKTGPYRVVTFTYGSGKDRYRPEFGAKARFLTRSVDGSKLDERWTGLGGWARSLYWGFGSGAFPMQGRVWAPDTSGPGAAQGPFPLVLIVHGNHQMEAFSDPGYAYLGRLLASQGFILVSVDENFLNSSLADEINPFATRNGQENVVRGWMLLEHLAQWRAWTTDPHHPLFGKADMNHIGLIGHSRGGEAVALANALNDLRAYPGDATLPFDFHFKIGAIAAIAPIDGQYKPRDQPTPMRDTNYFVMHGSMDGDVTSFAGSSQYSRASFSGDEKAFKASLYVKGANHGQFNTTWGRYDNGVPFKWLLDARPIMPPGAQRRIAEVYLSAFLQATLAGRDGYRPLFEDARNGAAWLPNDFLVNNYADSDTRWLADFKSLDPTLGSSPGVTISGHDLSVWRETWARRKEKPLDTYVAILGWDDRVHQSRASYDIELGPTPPPTTAGTSLVFSAADAGVGSLPKDFHPPKDHKAKDRKAEDRQPLDWSIVVTDASGAVGRLPLSHDQPLYPQIKGEVRRLQALDDTPTSELVLRRYRFALGDFARANPRLDVTRLRSIRFDFDRSPRGAIALADVGLDPSP